VVLEGNDLRRKSAMNGRRRGRRAEEGELEQLNPNGGRSLYPSRGASCPDSQAESPGWPLSADCVNQPEETWRRRGGTFWGKGGAKLPPSPICSTPCEAAGSVAEGLSATVLHTPRRCRRRIAPRLRLGGLRTGRGVRSDRSLPARSWALGPTGPYRLARRAPSHL
jgi:hypothetical protein